MTFDSCAVVPARDGSRFRSPRCRSPSACRGRHAPRRQPPRRNAAPPPRPAPPAAPPAPAPHAMATLPTAAPSPDPRVGLAAGGAERRRRRSGTCGCCRTPRRPKSSLASPTPISPSPGSTRSRATTTATRSGTSRIRPGRRWHRPTRARASQSDVSVYRNLLFVSGEAPTGRLDCGMQGVPEPVSKDRLRGIRDLRRHRHGAPQVRGQRADLPRLAHAHRRDAIPRTPRTSTSTCPDHPASVGRGAARLSRRRPDRRPEHGALPHRGDQGAARRAGSRRRSSARRGFSTTCRRRRATQIRPDRPGGRGTRAAPDAAGAAATAAGVPRAPQPARRDACAGRRAPAAEAGAAPGGAGGRGRGGHRRCAPVPTSATTSPCIPRIGLAGGACGGYGLLLDISDVANPKRIDAAADSNLSFWHSATFNNDGSKILFTDEWGGGIPAALPRHRQARVGRQRALHDREQQDDVQELLQDAGARRRRSRTASRTTAR